MPKIFHPFIAGGHNITLNNIMEENCVKVNVPPPSVYNNEITIAGDKKRVQMAVEKIKQIYEKMVRIVFNGINLSITYVLLCIVTIKVTFNAM